MDTRPRPGRGQVAFRKPCFWFQRGLREIPLPNSQQGARHTAGGQRVTAPTVIFSAYSVKRRINLRFIRLPKFPPSRSSSKRRSGFRRSLLAARGTCLPAARCVSPFSPPVLLLFSEGGDIQHSGSYGDGQSNAPAFADSGRRGKSMLERQ